MILEMKIPSPGESISEVEIAEWLVTDGEYVEKDQIIAEIDSDKATLELPAEQSGSITLKAEVKLKAQTSEEKDLGCITLLKLASEKSKNAGEMIKYEKLKKLQKSFQNKYKVGYFSEENVQSKIDEHNLKIKEKGQRYINKNLQKCGLK